MAPQSVYESHASDLASKLNQALGELDPEKSDDAPGAPSGTAVATEVPASRVCRKEDGAKLKLRLESIPGFARHSRKCQICCHPEIEDIEDEFISWTSADRIKKAFKLNGESTLYRHARATGLDVRRRENLSVVLEKVLEEVDNLDMPTVSEVLRAARVLAHLNARGQWIFPPAPENSNRQTYEKLELGVSDTKQTMEVISNRQS